MFLEQAGSYNPQALYSRYPERKSVPFFVQLPSLVLLSPLFFASSSPPLLPPLPFPPPHLRSDGVQVHEAGDDEDGVGAESRLGARGRAHRRLRPRALPM